ncbi:hypothetical protein [Lentzea sp.]|uniref:hypothetical protein n=1 Tax=Lentzea sp. TaxID=56099 RepID=UPI002C9163CC|nr:hypothetical protein [Lentzea sp.]HUQ54388.1 hypothetical protein [Lentzea sp.]
MKNSIRIAFLAALVAGMAACTSAPAPQRNAAPVTTTSADVPAPAPSTSVATEVVTATVTSTVTNPPKAATRVDPVDTRLGYGPLKLGMTLDEVKATGWVDPNLGEPDAGGCWWNSQVLISKKYGLVRITLPVQAKTSAGIGAGSTFADVKRAYPDAKEYRDGFSAKVAEKVHYSFIGPAGNERFADADKVVRIKIASSELDCALAYL